MDRRYKHSWDSWEQSSYPIRMEILNLIRQSSHRLSTLSIPKQMAKYCQNITTLNYLNDFLEQGYIKQLPKINRHYEYELTLKGEKYLNDYFKSNMRK
jgi:Fe2+ or Zn2+ uptake regulation protein